MALTQNVKKATLRINHLRIKLLQVLANKSGSSRLRKLKRRVSLLPAVERQKNVIKRLSNCFNYKIRVKMKTSFVHPKVIVLTKKAMKSCPKKSQILNRK